MIRTEMWITQSMVDTVNIVFWGCLAVVFVIIYVVGISRERRTGEKVPGFFASEKEQMEYVIKTTGVQTHPVNEKK